MNEKGKVNLKNRKTHKGKVGNIEYGNIEKFRGLLHRKQSDGNIEFNIDSKTGSNRVKRGPPWGGGVVTADDDRGCYDPI